MGGPRYYLVLEALPGDVPPETRLRAALKTLLRRFGLRCTRQVVELSGERPATDRAQPHPGGTAADQEATPCE
jgi:hypothetical protein